MMTLMPLPSNAITKKVVVRQSHAGGWWLQTGGFMPMAEVALTCRKTWAIKHTSCKLPYAAGA